MLNIILVFISLPLLATTFQLQTAEQQLIEADGVMMGHFLRKKSVKLDDGVMATQMVFKINREFGLQSDQFGMDEVIVHYPGGTIEGKTTVVDGTPEFVSGEKVVLLIQSVENRFWGLNLGLGSYKQVNYGKEIILVNSLVPNDPRVGQIRLEDFEKSVKNIKGSSMKTVSFVTPTITPALGLDRIPASSSESEGQNRSIASKAEKSENENVPSLSNFWLVAVLAFLGGCFRFMKQKTK
jgi:hypothetical protein